jgi:hypothetical protein
MACRSVWLSGRTDPLGRSSSSSKGHGRERAIGNSLPILAGGPLWAWPTTLLMSSRLSWALAGRPAVVGAVGGPLLDLDPLDGGRAGPLPVGPLGRVMRLGAEGPLRIRDVVAAPVVLELGGGLAPGPPTPGCLRHRPSASRT